MVAALIAVILLAACSPNPPARSLHGRTGSATAKTPATEPLQTATSGEFFSPKKTISCEIDDGLSLQQVFCETFDPRDRSRWPWTAL
jgi:hypothetical protein